MNSLSLTHKWWRVSHPSWSCSQYRFSLSSCPQEHAFESSQKYKEGKFIIELAHMIKDNGWDWASVLERASRWRVDGECVGEWLTLVCHYPLKPSSTLHLLLTHTPLAGAKSGVRAAPGGFVCLEERAHACVCVCVSALAHGSTQIHECIHKVYRHMCVKTTAYALTLISARLFILQAALFIHVYDIRQGSEGTLCLAGSGSRVRRADGAFSTLC